MIYIGFEEVRVLEMKVSETQIIRDEDNPDIAREQVQIRLKLHRQFETEAEIYSLPWGATTVKAMLDESKGIDEGKNNSKLTLGRDYAAYSVCMKLEEKEVEEAEVIPLHPSESAVDDGTDPWSSVIAEHLSVSYVRNTDFSIPDLMLAIGTALEGLDDPLKLGRSDLVRISTIIKTLGFSSQRRQESGVRLTFYSKTTDGLPMESERVHNPSAIVASFAATIALTPFAKAVSGHVIVGWSFDATVSVETASSIMRMVGRENVLCESKAHNVQSSLNLSTG